MPGMSGRLGRLSCPTAEMTARAGSGLECTVGTAQCDLPRARAVVPARGDDLRVPADVRLDAVALHDVGEVRLDLGLACEVLGPMIARFERVAVEVVADVDAATGVGVLEPRAADLRVLLDDRERNPGLLQPDAGEKARLAATDDHDREGRTRLRSGVELDPAARPRRRAPSPRASSARTLRERPRRRANSSSRGRGPGPAVPAAGSRRRDTSRITSSAMRRTSALSGSDM